MSRTIECFLIEPTNRYRVCLRRYSRSLEAKCPTNGWCHNADTFVGVETHPNGPPTSGDKPEVFPHDDARWPKTCAACGYVFPEEDYWQVNYECVYEGPDGKEYTTIEKNQVTSDRALSAPLGAMWRATWLEPKHGGPDGHSYILRTPGGDWPIDAGFPNGRWTRTGVAPKLTANPSILIGKDANGQWAYHGWLRDGMLVEC